MIVYAVYSEFFDNGKATAYMKQLEVDKMPENTDHHSPRSDRYTDFYSNKKDAEKAVDDVRKA